MKTEKSVDEAGLRKAVARAQKEKRTERINCGDGLILVVTQAGRARFLHRFPLRGRYPEHWFDGQFPEGISLGEARDLLEKDKGLIAQGINPADAAPTASSNPTFREFAEEHFCALAPRHELEKEMERSTWHRDMTFRVGALAKRKIDLIELADVVEAVRPYWIAEERRHRPTGKRLVNAIERTLRRRRLTANKANDHQANICFETVAEVLGNEPHFGMEREALEFEDAPEFMVKLKAVKTMGARLTEFIILTGCRNKEGIGAKWGEIDREAKTWTIPVARLKTEKRKGAGGRPFIVPLSTAALALLDEVAKHLPCAPGDLIFPSFHHNKLVADQRHSEDTPLNTIQRIEPGVTTHGWRTTLTAWGCDAGYPLELMDRVLGHKIGYAKAERGKLSRDLARYARNARKDPFFRRRIPVMQGWSDYLEGKTVRAAPADVEAPQTPAQADLAA